MSVPKLLSLLNEEAIAFVRMDVLSARDPREGRLTHLEQEQLQSGNLPPSQDHLRGILPANLFSRTFQHIEEAAVTGNFVNCWNQNDHEPAQLWASYASETEGVAIKSSIDRMITAFRDYEHLIYCGAINYVDYSTTSHFSGNSFSYVFRKQIQYQSEREVRLCIQKHPEYDPDELLIKSVPCHLSVLIQEIRLAPFAPAYVNEALEGVIRRFLPNVRILPSDLGA